MKQHDRRTIVVAEAWKRYSAVLMGGQHADAAYWFDTALGNMVTSDYYLPAYPAWVDIFNKKDPTAAFFGRPWLGHQLSTKSKPDAAYRDALRGTTYTNDVQLDFTAALLANTQLGRDDVPDFLGVSFSAMDQIGHVYGPDTPEMDEMVVQMDRQLGVLMRMLDERVGLGNWTMALVSDHGAAELPEKVKARGEDAGRMDIPKFKAAVVKELSATYSGADRLISAFEAPEFYLDYAEGERQGADAATLERAVARAALKQPGIARVYTRNQILAAGPTSDEFLRAIANGFHPGRSGDIYMVVKPNYFLWGEKGTHHGTPYEYDQHVPLIFYGAGIAKRTDTDRVLINDLAPTLAAIAGTTMHGLPGRILTSALGEPQ
jgi:predicted AlkP superfamily pyrophosphatase or phosphodiesterase